MSTDHFTLASSYHEDGRLDLAERHYRETLRAEPDRWDASFGLAQVLVRQDRFDEAVGLLTQLLNRPGDSAAVTRQMGFAVYRQLGFAETYAGRRQRALDNFRRALEHEPDDAATWHIVANLQQALGFEQDARESYRRALQLKPLVTVPAAIAPPDFRVLFVFGPGAGNTPIEYLIGHARFESNILTLLQDTDYDVERMRAYADVAVNLISDVDRGYALLGPAQALVDGLGCAVVNPPGVIAGTSRDAVARRLANVPGCCVPQTRRYPAAELRARLARAQQEPLPFPLLARPTGSHGGEHFERMENPAQLRAFVDQHAAAGYYLTPFVDYRSADGYFRKYRFMCVGDEILPYHLAIDDKWKVHHATTPMDGNAQMQEEERAFLDDPWRVFGAAQRDALRAIRDTIGLDYFGIDCSLARDGAVVVFEVNASMLIHGNNARFPYKTDAVQRIRDAFQSMLARRAQQGQTRSPD